MQPIIGSPSAFPSPSASVDRSIERSSAATICRNSCSFSIHPPPEPHKGINLNPACKALAQAMKAKANSGQVPARKKTGRIANAAKALAQNIPTANIPTASPLVGKSSAVEIAPSKPLVDDEQSGLHKRQLARLHLPADDMIVGVPIAEVRIIEIIFFLVLLNDVL